MPARPPAAALAALAAAMIAAALVATPALAAAQGAILGADDVTFTGEAQLEATLFPLAPRFPGQDNQFASVALEPELVIEWDDVAALDGADVAFTLTPFLRLDPQDDRRTHLDLREAKIDVESGPWSLTVGADFVFWGKAEADQIVDIINQTDAVEGFDGEDKLGQPMVRLSRFIDIGDFSGTATGFFMPLQRERTFLGEDSRLRGRVLVEDDDAEFRTAQDEFTPSFAGRVDGFIGDVDAAVSVFHGLSRDPAFRFDPARGRLIPVYDRITQLGFDGQYTSDATLWKLETIARFNQLDARLRKQDYIGVIGGVEHTLFGVFDTDADLGLIAEYGYDSRGDAALAPFNNDLILGARLALNDVDDTDMLITMATDTETAETSFRLEGSTRLSDRFSLAIEAQAFANTQDGSPLDDLRDDHFVRTTLSVFW